MRPRSMPWTSRGRSSLTMTRRRLRRPIRPRPRKPAATAKAATPAEASAAPPAATPPRAGQDQRRQRRMREDEGPRHQDQDDHHHRDPARRLLGRWRAGRSANRLDQPLDAGPNGAVVIAGANPGDHVVVDDPGSEQVGIPILQAVAHLDPEAVVVLEDKKREAVVEPLAADLPALERLDGPILDRDAARRVVDVDDDLVAALLQRTPPDDRRAPRPPRGTRRRPGRSPSRWEAAGSAFRRAQRRWRQAPPARQSARPTRQPARPCAGQPNEATAGGRAHARLRTERAGPSPRRPAPGNRPFLGTCCRTGWRSAPSGNGCAPC